MRSTTLRWIMLSCSIIITLILLAQLYWLKRVYNLEDQQFNSGVIKSIRGLFSDIEIGKDPRMQINQVVNMVDAHTYMVKLDSIPQKDSLEHYLRGEFEDFDVWADCNVGVFNSSQQTFSYQFYLSTAASSYPQVADPNLPVIKKGHHYLLLDFPHRSKYIIHEMMFWIVGAVLLLLILIGLSISLLYLYRQKFLNELQKDFVDNFTHEFKTPLAVMKIAGDVLVQPGIVNKPDRLRKYSTVMLEQTEHLQQQVERLLKTTAGNSNRLVLKKEPCQLNLLAQKAIEQIEPLIKSKGANVELVTDENEPVIYADKNHLQLVIINLLENALKYCKNQPHIIIQLHNGDSDLYTISVKDNGIGIDKKNIKYLFNKFYRVPTGNIHDVTGFGLGLNFVKKVIDAHNGKVSINSVPGIGTEFKIQLPKK
jgi:two-component system, OmpR family, phosphate regulon sensor histidine kinase PhoR